MRAAAVCLFFAAIHFCAFAGGDDDRLRSHVAKADAVVIGEITSDPVAKSEEDGVVHYACDFIIAEVLQADKKLPAEIKVNIVRLEKKSADRPAELKKGGKCILFLKSPPPKGVVWQSVDVVFGFQPSSPALVESLRRAAGAADQKAEGVFEAVVHAEAQAWQFTGVRLPKGYVAKLTASGEWKPNPHWKYKVAAGGDANSKIDAGKNYVKPGVKEGCLLARSEDTIAAFTRDDSTVTLTTPGKIYLVVNDEPTPKGAAAFQLLLAGPRAKEFADAIPIPGVEGIKGSGFTDNSGALKVRIEVKKAQ